MTRSAAGPATRGVLLPTPSHAAAASQQRRDADASLPCRASDVSLPRRAAVVRQQVDVALR